MCFIKQDICQSICVREYVREVHIGQWGARKKLWEAALSAQAAAFGRGAGDTDSFPVLQCPLPPPSSPPPPTCPQLPAAVQPWLPGLEAAQASNTPQPFHLEGNMF